MSITSSKFNSRIQYYVYKTIKHDEYFGVLNSDGSINIDSLVKQIAKIYGQNMSVRELIQVLQSLLNIEGNHFVCKKKTKFYLDEKLPEMLLLKRLIRHQF